MGHVILIITWFIRGHTCTPVSLTSIDHLGCFKSFLLFICWNANDFQNAWGILCIISDSSRSFIVLFVQIDGSGGRCSDGKWSGVLIFCPVWRSFSRLGVFSLCGSRRECLMALGLLRVLVGPRWVPSFNISSLVSSVWSPPYELTEPYYPFISY